MRTTQLHWNASAALLAKFFPPKNRSTLPQKTELRFILYNLLHNLPPFRLYHESPLVGRAYQSCKGVTNFPRQNFPLQKKTTLPQTKIKVHIFKVHIYKVQRTSFQAVPRCPVGNATLLAKIEGCWITRVVHGTASSTRWRHICMCIGIGHG